MIEIITQYIVPAALSLLPSKMADHRATALLLAIGLQESRFRYRAQVGGPARGFWQFEVGGVKGVMTHKATAEPLKSVLQQLAYPPLDERTLHAALEHNDVLAAAVARLLLWTLPGAPPERGDAVVGWGQYLAAWRPGKPHEATWGAFYETAWGTVQTVGASSKA